MGFSSQNAWRRHPMLTQVREGEGLSEATAVLRREGWLERRAAGAKRRQEQH